MQLDDSKRLSETLSHLEKLDATDPTAKCLLYLIPPVSAPLSAPSACAALSCVLCCAAAEPYVVAGPIPRVRLALTPDDSMPRRSARRQEQQSQWRPHRAAAQ